MALNDVELEEIGKVADDDDDDDEDLDNDDDPL